jgi:acetolactate synthase-1/2/3 large subunit
MNAETVANATPFVLAEGQTGMNPGQMVMAVREAFSRDAVTVVDGGNTTLWTVALNPIYEADSFLYSVKMGYLGTGLPFAVGAKLAAPHRPVYLITGDGALGFNVMELETALRWLAAGAWSAAPTASRVSRRSSSTAPTSPPRCATT